MQTMYYKTSNFIQHQGNVVDLEEFRRRTAAAQRDSLARRMEEDLWQEEPAEWEPEESGFRPVVLTLDKKTRRRLGRERRAWLLDIWASAAVMLMTLVFVLRVMA